jgi:2,3,4,5-tetrahydropyridine-2-carboxylate N-succinyltransferase
MNSSDRADTQKLIEQAWDSLDAVTSDARAAVAATLKDLDRGVLRVASRDSNGKWHVRTWVKKAILLSFRFHPNKQISGGPNGDSWWDKVNPKFANWTEKDFSDSNLRLVPQSYVRYSAYIAPNVVLMPSFVNLGAYIDTGTMIDTWATVGSCAQIGKNVHISGGCGIGGVLEPLQSSPVIIEDNCFIGARSEVAEGVIVREGAVLSMGVYLGASTKIVDRQTGDIFLGEVPPYSVVVPGNLPAKNPMANGQQAPSLYCAVIVKKVDERTRSKVSVNSILRESASEL